jgi:hemoglobin
MTRKKLSLYARLGGYDVIAAIVDDLFALLRADARFSRFAIGRTICPGIPRRDISDQG